MNLKKLLSMLLIVTLLLSPVALMEETIETQEESVESAVVEVAEAQASEPTGEEAAEDTTANPVEEQEDESAEEDGSEFAEEQSEIDEEIAVDAVDDTVEEQPAELGDDDEPDLDGAEEFYESENSLLMAAGMEGVEISETNFPDEDFRTYISLAFDSDGNGVLSEEERLGVEKIALPYIYTVDDVETWIFPRNLTGIKLFPNLQELSLTDGEYSWNDVAIETLDASGCSNLQKIKCRGAGLQTLDVSDCINLRELDCSDNSELTTLDMRNCNSLEKLDYGYTKLGSVDIGEFTNLRELCCYGCGLSSLDVSNNTKLTALWCDDNKLSSLDISANTQLTELYCPENNLTSLNLRNNPRIESLYCHENNLSELDLSSNTNLRDLSLYGNHLSVLDISNCPNLIDILTVFYKYESMTKYGGFYDFGAALVIDNNVVLTPAPPEDEIVVCIDKEHFPDAYFCEFVKKTFDHDTDGYLSMSESRSVVEIDFGDDWYDMEGYEMEMTNIKGHRILSKPSLFALPLCSDRV